jgi:hypothetical protein
MLPVPRSRWRLAFLISLLLHLGGGLALSLISGLIPVDTAAGSATVPITCVNWDKGEAEGGAYFTYDRPTGAGKADNDSSEESEITTDPAPIQSVLVMPAESSSNAETGTTPPVSHSGTQPGDGPGKVTGSKPGAGMSAGPGTGKDGTSFFQIETQARRVVYVIDRSSSMGKQGALARACRELVASLLALPPDASFQIIVYNSTAQTLLPAHPGWLQATDANRELAAAALDQLEAVGGTRHQLALPMALSLRPDVIFFLTDADDLTPAYVREVTSQNRNHAVVHVIELNPSASSDGNMPLQVLARENGGVYRAAGLVTPP